jgi:hypothetical protein
MYTVRVYNYDDVVLEERFNDFELAQLRQENLQLSREYASDSYTVEIEGENLSYTQEGFDF